MEPISADFEKELALLRDKLEEAEDVRRAITHGEVDAFVVGPGGSGRVLLLANAYQRYRQLVERMQPGRGHRDCRTATSCSPTSASPTCSACRSPSSIPRRSRATSA